MDERDLYRLQRECDISGKQVDKILGQEILRGLVNRLDAILKTFPEGAFARLGTGLQKIAN